MEPETIVVGDYASGINIVVTHGSEAMDLNI